MKTQIKFKQETTSIGRNGFIKTVGVDVFKTNWNFVEFVPINSKGYLSNCQVTIPAENIPELIELLTEMLNSK